MVMRGRRFTVRRGSGRRRKLVWARSYSGPVGVSLAAGTTIGVDLMGDLANQLGADLLGATAIRIRGVWGTHPVTNITTPYVVTLGIKQCDNNEFALAGPSGGPGTAASTVGPRGADRYGAWMFIDHSLMLANASVGPTTQAGGPLVRPIDNRAKRKIDEMRMTIGAFFESDTNSGQAALVAYSVSMLLALP